jgi:hypothetical protein
MVRENGIPLSLALTLALSNMPRDGCLWRMYSRWYFR